MSPSIHISPSLSHARGQVTTHILQLRIKHTHTRTDAQISECFCVCASSVCVTCLRCLFMRNFRLLARLVVCVSHLSQPRRPHSNFNICLLFFASKRPRVTAPAAAAAPAPPNTPLLLSLSFSLSRSFRVGQAFICFIRFYCCFHFSLPNVCQRRTACETSKKATYKLTETATAEAT